MCTIQITNNAIQLGPQMPGSCIEHMGHRQWQGYAKGLDNFALKGLLHQEIGVAQV